MTIAECRELKKGDKVRVSLGDGWYQDASFIKLIKVTSFGKMTINEVLTGDFDFSTKGREKTEAYVEYVDDRGRKRQRSVNPRRLRRGI